MAHLHVDPSAPWYIHEAVDAVLVLHIGGGTVGLLSGATGLIEKKGEWLHRASGKVFFASMMVMATIGASVSPLLHDRVSTVAGIMTLYLLVSALLTVQRKEGTIGRLEIVASIVPLGVMVAGVSSMLIAANDPSGTIDGQPPQAFYVFAIVGGIAAVADARMILHRGISGVQRIARHLWRMCTALFVASGSLFLGQPQVFPASIRHSLLMFVPALAPLVLLIFWMVRVRIGNRFKAAGREAAQQPA